MSCRKPHRGWCTNGYRATQTLLGPQRPGSTERKDPVSAAVISTERAAHLDPAGFYLLSSWPTGSGTTACSFAPKVAPRRGFCRSSAIHTAPVGAPPLRPGHHVRRWTPQGLRQWPPRRRRCHPAELLRKLRAAAAIAENSRPVTTLCGTPPGISLSTAATSIGSVDDQLWTPGVWEGDVGLQVGPRRRHRSWHSKTWPA